jgi:hypothetical protein
MIVNDKQSRMHLTCWWFLLCFFLFAKRITTLSISTSTASPSLLNVPAGCYLHPSAHIVDLSPTERGIRVADNDNADSAIAILPNEVVLSVPWENIITPELGKKTPTGISLQRVLQDESTKSLVATLLVDDDIYLAIWLCHAVRHRDTGTLTDENARNYLDTLPTLDAMKHLPVFWSEADFKERQGHQADNNDYSSSSVNGHGKGSSHLLIDTRHKRDLWEMQYGTIVSDVPLFGKETSFDTFMWAKAVVGSRAFLLREEYFENDKDEGDSSVDSVIQRGIGLVPMADMLNHRSRSEVGAESPCDWRVETITTTTTITKAQEGDECSNGNGDGIVSGRVTSTTSTSKAFVIRSPPVWGQKAGSDAFISYGLHSNAHYLGQYGFCVERNLRHDGACPNEAHIHVELSQREGNGHGTGNNTNTSTKFAITVGDTIAAKALLSALRISAMATSGKEQQSSVAEQSVSTIIGGSLAHTSTDYERPFSVTNEVAAIKMLLESVETSLASYTTTLEEDTELLLANDVDVDVDLLGVGVGELLLPLGTKRRNLVLVRCGEKLVLQHWLLLCEAALLCLHDVERESSLTSWKDYCALMESTLERVVPIDLSPS